MLISCCDLVDSPPSNCSLNPLRGPPSIVGCTFRAQPCDHVDARLHWVTHSAYVCVVFVRAWPQPSLVFRRCLFLVLQASHLKHILGRCMSCWGNAQGCGLSTTTSSHGSCWMWTARTSSSLRGSSRRKRRVTRVVSLWRRAEDILLWTYLLIWWERLHFSTDFCVADKARQVVFLQVELNNIL